MKIDPLIYLVLVAIGAFALGFLIGVDSKKQIIIHCKYHYDGTLEFADKNVTFKLEE